MKQRLIGALVLLCGGVILWSLLFTGPAASKLDRHSQIPAAPQFEPLLEAEPERPEGITPADTELVPPQPVPRIDDEVSSVPVQAKSRPPAVAALAKPSSAPVAKPPVQQPSREAPTTKPGLDKHGLPLAWVVQVGVFGNADNAAALKKSLQGAGYKAFTDQIQRDGKRFHRVLVGPVLSEDKAVAQQGAINTRFNVKSIVNRFEP
ncbi:DedD protein [Zhongshania antarctica]|uniref:DedD protein n=1 Tax=Zhongshania antarctica TaxID=641702 RepID=A0A840QZU9_9GAMM|nr:SPOR domain-containing protein [Zhongshania antarctica]MBB5185762.1 DedD protein [Zhongshania antarctica]